MEDRLKGLRKSMENTTFKQLNFSEAHRMQIHKKFNQSVRKVKKISLLRFYNFFMHEKQDMN